MPLSYKISIVAVAIALGPESTGEVDSVRIIDFSAKHTLSEIFESVLRPKRQAGGENLICEVKSERIAFTLPDGKVRKRGRSKRSGIFGRFLRQSLRRAIRLSTLLCHSDRPAHRMARAHRQTLRHPAVVRSGVGPRQVVQRHLVVPIFIFSETHRGDCCARKRL